MNNKTLYISDLDGTLLNSQSKISSYAVEIINKLIEEGMMFSFATARSLSSAKKIVNKLGLNIPVITYNGTFIVDFQNEKKIISNIFSNDDNNYLIKLINEHNIYPLVYSLFDKEERVSWIDGKTNDGISHYINLRKGDKRLNPQNNITTLYDGTPFYYTCIGAKDELLPLYEQLEINPNYTTVFQKELYREEYWLEIMNKRATKAIAIENLKEMMDAKRVISFGDAINDIPMFKISHQCYAVSNAVDALKDIATSEISSNDKDGVVQWIKEHYRQSK